MFEVRGKTTILSSQERAHRGIHEVQPLILIDCIDSLILLLFIN